MAVSSSATASALAARTGTPQRSANAFPISDPSCYQASAPALASTGTALLLSPV